MCYGVAAPIDAVELGSNEAVKQSVVNAMGLGPASRQALKADPRDDGVVVLPLSRFPVLSSRR